MQWSSSLFWTNSFFMLVKTLESTKKFSWELTEKIWFQKIFASSKQMFSIDKNSTMLLRMNLPWIFTIYDIYALQKLSEDFQEDIFGRVILVYDCYSEQSVCNWPKWGLYNRYFLVKFLKMNDSGRLFLNSPRYLLVIKFNVSR